MKNKILIVDDDEDILDLLKYNLQKEGYQVKTITDSTTAMNVALRFGPDLIILDLMMPETNGIEVCKRLRQDDRLRDTVIFFLSAKSDEYYQHAVFNTGGDEFIEKIVGIKPLLSKISVVLRQNFVIRKRFLKLRAKPLELHRGNGVVMVGERRVELNRHEFEILFFFAQNRGRDISLSLLIKTLWGSSTFMDEGGLRRNLQSICEKIGEKVLGEIRQGVYRFS